MSERKRLIKRIMEIYDEIDGEYQDSCDDLMECFYSLRRDGSDKSIAEAEDAINHSIHYYQNKISDIQNAITYLAQIKDVFDLLKEVTQHKVEEGVV